MTTLLGIGRRIVLSFNKATQLGLFGMPEGKPNEPGGTPGHVRAHTRRLPSGKVVQVQEHMSGRDPAAPSEHVAQVRQAVGNMRQAKQAHDARIATSPGDRSGVEAMSQAPSAPSFNPRAVAAYQAAGHEARHLIGSLRVKGAAQSLHQKEAGGTNNETPHSRRMIRESAHIAAIEPRIDDHLTDFAAAAGKPYHELSDEEHAALGGHYHHERRALDVHSRFQSEGVNEKTMMDSAKFAGDMRQDGANASEQIGAKPKSPAEIAYHYESVRGPMPTRTAKEDEQVRAARRASLERTAHKGIADEAEAEEGHPPKGAEPTSRSHVDRHPEFKPIAERMEAAIKRAEAATPPDDEGGKAGIANSRSTLDLLTKPYEDGSEKHARITLDQAKGHASVMEGAARLAEDRGTKDKTASAPKLNPAATGPAKPKPEKPQKAPKTPQAPTLAMIKRREHENERMPSESLTEHIADTTDPEHLYPGERIENHDGSWHHPVHNHNGDEVGNVYRDPTGTFHTTLQVPSRQTIKAGTHKTHEEAMEHIHKMVRAHVATHRDDDSFAHSGGVHMRKYRGQRRMPDEPAGGPGAMTVQDHINAYHEAKAHLSGGEGGGPYHAGGGTSKAIRHHAIALQDLGYAPSSTKPKHPVGAAENLAAQARVQSEIDGYKASPSSMAATPHTVHHLEAYQTMLKKRMATEGPTHGADHVPSGAEGGMSIRDHGLAHHDAKFVQADPALRERFGDQQDAIDHHAKVLAQHGYDADTFQPEGYKNGKEIQAAMERASKEAEHHAHNPSDAATEQAAKGQARGAADMHHQRLALNSRGRQ